MLKITSLPFLLFALFTYVVTEEIETYSDKYDFIDVDEILDNQRLRDQYYDCFMEFGPCVTADQKFFAEVIAEAIRTQCKKCTDKQKIMLEKVAEHYSTNNPAKWDALIQKFVIGPSQLNKETGSK